MSQITHAIPQLKRCGLIEATSMVFVSMKAILIPQLKRCGLIEARRWAFFVGRRHFDSAAETLRPH